MLKFLLIDPVSLTFQLLFWQHADEGNGMNGGDGGVVEATDSSNLDYWTGDSSNFWEEKASSDEDGHSQVKQVLWGAKAALQLPYRTDGQRNL